MFKQLNSQANTKEIKKIKLLQSYRVNPTQRNKVMLTDLCPEQKAKIGDLVRTLQTRKSENQILQLKLNQMQKKQKQYLQKIQELQSLIDQDKMIQIKLRQQLQLNKIRQQEREKYIQHLLNEKQLKSKENQNKKQTVCVQQFAITDPIITLNQGIQVNQKRKKCKQKQVQVQLNVEEVRRYPNNSKSFQKIMKKRSQSNSVDKPIGNRTKKSNSKRSAIIINDEYDSQQNAQVDESIQKQEDQEGVDGQQYDQDNDFNQLAKKWLQLKQKNMTKIKESYNKSKQKVRNSSNGKSMKKISKTIDIPRQFNQKNIAEEDQEGGSCADDNHNNFENNESFGPKKSKKKSHKKQSEPIDQDFDQIELNRILKSKNFSASRLLSKNRSNSPQSQVQKQAERISKYELKNSGHQKRPIKIESYSYTNRPNLATNTPNMKTSGISNTISNYNNTNSNNIDFYQTDLLDIVSSINRK